jgi:hypothetical protein
MRESDCPGSALTETLDTTTVSDSYSYSYNAKNALVSVEQGK